MLLYLEFCIYAVDEGRPMRPKCPASVVIDSAHDQFTRYRYTVLTVNPSFMPQTIPHYESNGVILFYTVKRQCQMSWVMNKMRLNLTDN